MYVRMCVYISNMASVHVCGATTWLIQATRTMSSHLQSINEKTKNKQNKQRCASATRCGTSRSPAPRSSRYASGWVYISASVFCVFILGSTAAVYGYDGPIHTRTQVINHVPTNKHTHEQNPKKVDELGFREGIPLRGQKRHDYLQFTADAFRCVLSDVFLVVWGVCCILYFVLFGCMCRGRLLCMFVRRGE